MKLTRLNIRQFRNLLSLNIKPLVQGFNIIYGDNGSGKTSILEAIYYLARGRSFRSSLTHRLINHHADCFSLFAELVDENLQVNSVGIERSESNETQIRLNGQNVASIAEVIDLFPIQLIHSHSHTLLEAPQFRRKYMDWGVFYSSNQFLPAWRRFQKALKQRNASLRTQRPTKEIDVWTREVIDSGCFLDEMRKNYINILKPLLLQIVEQLLTISDLKIDYQNGWDNEIAYGEYLAQTIDKDRQSGYTQNGPHRADFKVLINGIAAKDILSRGQQKLFVCAMMVAQGILLKNDMNKKLIYLVDDLPSELDTTSRSKLLSLLSQQNSQVFVTAVDRQIERELKDHPMKMFHVEHGAIDETREDASLLCRIVN